MNKKKILIIVLCALVITAIVLGFLFVSGKNKLDVVINVGKSVAELNSSKEQNVYIKQTNGDNYSETYMLNDCIKDIQYDKENGTKFTHISTPTRYISYFENADKKVMTISSQEKSDDIIDKSLDNTENYSYLSNFFDTISIGLGIKISSEVVDGKDCYVIKNNSSASLNSSSIQYIDKETNLPIKITDEKGTEVTTFEYSFGIVNENDVAELDSTGFTLLSEEEFDNYEFVD